MSHDPGPETVEAPAEDVAEQATPSAADADVELPLEAVDADVVEQAASTGPRQPARVRELPLEADAADAVEQSVEVELDEDEHRSSGE